MGFHQHQKESPCNQNKFMDGANGAGQKPSRIAVVDGSDSPQTRWMAFASPIHYSPHGSAAGSPPGRTLLLDKSSFCGGNSTKATSGINGAGRSFRQHHYHPQTGVASWRVASIRYDLEYFEMGTSWEFDWHWVSKTGKILDFYWARCKSWKEVGLSNHQVGVPSLTQWVNMQSPRTPLHTLGVEKVVRGWFWVLPTLPEKKGCPTQCLLYQVCPLKVSPLWFRKRSW